MLLRQQRESSLTIRDRSILFLLLLKQSAIVICRVERLSQPCFKESLIQSSAMALIIDYYY